MYPSQNFRKSRQKRLNLLSLEYGDTVQHLDIDAVMEHILWVLIAITRPAGCTPALAEV
jgi:hypothetical protein